MNKKNITRLAFAIVIVSFVLSTFVSLWSLRVMAERNMQELSKTLAARIYDSVNSELSEPITVSRTMANNSLLIETLKNEPDAGIETTERVLAAYLAALKDTFGYVTADLNGLKTVNDTLGHAAGDELIRGAADCLKAAFGEYGDIYRIGGDEFAAILNLTEAQHTEAMAALDLTSEQWHSQQLEGLSISCGWASSREFPSENIAEIMKISDKRMYAAKEAYDKETGKDRRRS